MFFRPQPHSVYQWVYLQFLMENVSVSVWSQQERRPHNVSGEYNTVNTKHANSLVLYESPFQFIV